MTADITCGETDINSWLERIYYRTEPLYDPSKETKAPIPNMFGIILPSGAELDFPITQWNSSLTLTEAFPDSSTMFIKFFTRTTTTDILYGMSALPCAQQN